jgi:hypothetical protein
MSIREIEGQSSCNDLRWSQQFTAWLDHRSTGSHMTSTTRIRTESLDSRAYVVSGRAGAETKSRSECQTAHSIRASLLAIATVAVL